MKELVAPRDPEKVRPYFYILKNKEIFGERQKNGTGIQYLYQSDGRLINSAQIVGNISDETELKLLETTAGFYKLVHSVGVSVELEDPKEELEFVFQMYGKKNLYGGGTCFCTKLCGDGMEKRIYLADYEMKEDDDIPGQIKILFDTPELLGKVNVRLFLNDGYDAPVEEAEEKIDYVSRAYQEMIQRSLMQPGNPCRIQNAIRRARAGEKVTLAYIGGSITQGAGAVPIHTECYAYKSYRLFEKKFASEHNVVFCKAGVGGTPSELGMIRFDRDILRGEEKPDIIVIEFAVNDEGDETKGDCYESLVRKVLALPWKPAVVLLFSVFANDWNLQKRLKPVGERYDLPMVSIMDAVTPQFTMKAGEGKVLTKNQFFYDMFHPTNVGHTIMADCLQYLFEWCDCAPEMADTLEEKLKQKPVIGNTFEKVRLLDRKELPQDVIVDEGAFTETDAELQGVEMDAELSMTYQFPNNWMYRGTEEEHAYFEMTIECRALLLVFKDSGEVNVGKADVYMDGRYQMKADPHVNNWLHCNVAIILNERQSGKHTVRIEVDQESREKNFTILGFGYVR